MICLYIITWLIIGAITAIIVAKVQHTKVTIGNLILFSIGGLFTVIISIIILIIIIIIDNKNFFNKELF